MTLIGLQAPGTTQAATAGVQPMAGATTGIVALQTALAAAREAEAGLLARAERLEARVAELQQRLTHAQKMEMIGQLTSSVVHDFNNFLTVVLANAESLRTVAEAAGNARGVRQAEMIERAGERAARLASQLLAFARKQTTFAETTAVAPLLTGMQELFRRAAAKSNDLAIRCGSDVWPIRVDQTQLESAVLNLVINAHDAIPAGGGSIVIAAGNVALQPAAAAPLGVPAGDYVRISVTDNGSGIAPDLLTQIFNPFFTTKGPGEGSGLGLSQVQAFVTESGGAVAVESAPGRGTTIALLLPRTVEAGAQPASAAPLAQMAGNGRCVLLVEDQDDLRETARTMLEDRGYRVLEAEDAAAARAILADTAPISVLFADLVLPGGMSGIELAREARRLRPGITVLLTSGYTKDMLDRLGVDAKEFHFLLKPYSTDKLTARITRLLAGAVPPPLVWSAAHDVGIQAMDEQHARLGERLNDLANVLRKGEDHAAAMQEVIRYTAFHFAAEEQLIAQHGVRDAAAHVQEHRRLLAEIHGFRPGADGKSVTLALDYLQAWLLNHVDGDDRALAEQLRAQGLR